MKAFINPQWAEALGLTLFDSLWQGALVLIASFVVLLFMKKASPAKRYSVVLIALLILPTLSIVTFTQHFDPNYTTSSFVPSSISSDNSALFALDLSETSISAEQAPVSLTFLAKWKVWTAQNANWALLVWLMGAFLFTVRMLGGFYFLNRLKSRAIPITDSEWVEKMATLCKSLKIKGKVLLKQSGRVSSPLVMGVIKPVIIFPMGLIQALPTDEIEAILVHELAHIKRKDFLINIVINLLQVVYFFHPAFWWLKAQLDAEREYHCDDITLHQLGKKLTLIRALTNASEYQGQKFQPALAFAGKKNQLLNRVKRIVYHKPQMNWLSGFMSLGILVLSFVLMSQSVSQEDKPAMVGPEEQNIEKLMQEPIVQDTTKVNKAILELLKPGSKVIVKTNASGLVTMIMNDKTEITGEEFEAYKTAYNQIHKFSEETQRDQEELVKTKIEKFISETRKIQETAQNKSNETSALSERLKKQEQEALIAKIQIDQETLRAKRELGEIEKELKVKGLTDHSLAEKYNAYIKELEAYRSSIELATFDAKKNETAVKEIVEWVNKAKEEEKQVELARLELVELVKLEEKVATQKIQEDTTRMAYSPVFESIKKTGKISPEDSNLLYEIDGKLAAKEAFYRLKSEEVISISVLKSVPEILAAHPEIKIKNPALLQIATIRNRANMTIRSLDFNSKKTIYELDNEIIDIQGIRDINVDLIQTIQIINNQDQIRKKYPQLKGNDLSLIRLSTKRDNDLTLMPTVYKLPFTATVKSRDFTSVDFGNSITYNSQLELVEEWLDGKTFIIELDGELKPEMTFVDISHIDGLKIKTFEIIKNDKMYEYHKKRKLKGYDALIRIVTK